jgi:choline dehydrogenase-like flavoprotein
MAPTTPGTDIRVAHSLTCDVVIVGSGPAGAAAARTLSRAGVSVIVVEEGPATISGGSDGFTAMADLYRDMGASVTTGRAPSPYVQGRVVGGGSVVNGAISWRLPHPIHHAWLAADGALEQSLDWTTLEAITDQIERDLNIAPTPPSIAGPNNLLLARGAEALGLAHRPIFRSVRGCEGRGQCLQGCPVGAKMSMDRTYLRDACTHSARIVSSCRALRVVVERGRARGIEALAKGGGKVTVRADRVVLAASAIQTPLLLLASGLRQGPVGQYFQCHPGISVTGRFKEPVRMWTGATQGHEVTGLVSEGIKFEALGFDMAVLASRVNGVGASLAEGIADFAHLATWGAAIRAEATGRVERSWWGTRVRYDMTPHDALRVRRGVSVLGKMLLAAGAEWVALGVHGWPSRIRAMAELDRFAAEGPTNLRAYASVITHMFGTCRMGSNAEHSVVDPTGEHHHVRGLYVVDSSVFPTNTGVNPQTSILAIATALASGMAKA